MSEDWWKKEIEKALTPSTALLNKLIGVNPTPRMLTPYEIELLRKSKKEIGASVRQRLKSVTPVVK